MASVVPALPSLAKSLQADYATVQFVVSAYLLGLGLFQPVQGLLSDRYGRSARCCSPGYSVFLVRRASPPASPTDIAMVIAAPFLQAMGVSVATVVTRAIVRDSFEPGPAATALSFITAVMGVAPGDRCRFVGGLASDAAGWRGIFWLHAAVALFRPRPARRHLREYPPGRHPRR
jgi:DHA1 family bicyclomycin/chloramphenicol resistance-like MFS transporter